MEKTPDTCEHYVDMLGYCELKDSCSMACNLCPYEGRICNCPDYQTRESKEAHFIIPQPMATSDTNPRATRSQFTNLSPDSSGLCSAGASG